MAVMRQYGIYYQEISRLRSNKAREIFPGIDQQAAEDLAELMQLLA
jgi:hypothetical protein